MDSAYVNSIICTNCLYVHEKKMIFCCCSFVTVTMIIMMIFLHRKMYFMDEFLFCASCDELSKILAVVYNMLGTLPPVYNGCWWECLYVIWNFASCVFDMIYIYYYYICKTVQIDRTWCYFTVNMNPVVAVYCDY